MSHVISANEWPSRRESAAISANLSTACVISGHQRPSGVISGHQGSSAVIKRAPEYHMRHVRVSDHAHILDLPVAYRS